MIDAAESGKEGYVANFCISCGKPVPEKAKFCPHCGENLNLGVKPRKEPETHSHPGNSGSHPSGLADSGTGYMYTLLDPGKAFRGYTIQRMMNKDTEGIKYIVEKNQKLYILKVFYKSNLSNLDALFAQQMRLVKLNHLKDKHIAKVVEVNQQHDPAYMVAEYIHGNSLANIKQHDPSRITEAFIRQITPQLIQTAIVIRQHGLALGKLNLNSVMIDQSNQATILSSSITYEDRDEREDIFNLGAVLAQALSQSPMYKNLYGPERLITQKFSNITGISLSFNKILGDCLQRNIIQRYTSWQTLLNAVENLPPIEGDDIWTQPEKTDFTEMEKVNPAEKPKTNIEIWFWLLILLIVSFIVLLMTTNLFSVLFRGKEQPFQYTGFLGSATKNDTTYVAPKDTLNNREVVSQTTYGQLKSAAGTPTADFRRNIISQDMTQRTTAPAISKPRPPANMIYFDAPTLGFGRLKDNLHHNVSLSSFYISRAEVTQAEWNRYMKPANCTTIGDNLPVDNVSWFDIAIYCNGRSEAEGLVPAYKIRGIGAARAVTCDFNANGYRLPTEAEWEVAAKSGDLYNYSGSDDPADIAWYKDNSGGRLHAPGGKLPNGSGLYDMTGNVAEWCWDWYDNNYVRALPTFINPSGPSTGTTKVIRGGGINNGEGRNLNILWREKGDPNRGLQYVGFRLVRSG